MGRAATDVIVRTLAMTSGVSQAAVPRFDTAASSVQRGGVLSALPMLNSEAKRKEIRKPHRQVSSDEKYTEDLEKHNYSNDVIDEIKKITQLFIERILFFVLNTKLTNWKARIVGFHHCICILENLVIGTS